MTPKRLPRGASIGILGGGQLGRMLAIAAAKLGFKPIVYAAEADAPAFQVVGRSFQGSYLNASALRPFAEACDVVTFEFENVPAETLLQVNRFVPVYPPPLAAAVAQDRLEERKLLDGLGIAVAPYIAITPGTEPKEVAEFLSRHGKAILKTSRDGYDGKGQARISSMETFQHEAAKLNGPFVLEAQMPFAEEVSIVAVRGSSGSMAFYDISRNVHREGILRTSTVPVGPALEARVAEARAVATKIAVELDYTGVLAVEFFVMTDGASPQLVVNEIAPRVHNSGHWTLDACFVSQFENHIRAVAGWPLGSTGRHSGAVMTNLIGPGLDRWIDGMVAAGTTCVYVYGKEDLREGRKAGHVTELTPLVGK